MTGIKQASRERNGSITVSDDVWKVSLRDRQDGNIKRKTMSLFRQRKKAHTTAIAKWR
jgi:hypothetical protein